MRRRYGAHMRRARAAVGLVTAAVAVSAGLAASGGAGAREFVPDCKATTALAPQPHRLDFRVRCNFEAEWIGIDPTNEIRKVRRKTTLRHPDPEDRVRCKRDGQDAVCEGRAGDGVTVIGTMRVRGARCTTDTRFGIQGGVDCDNGDSCIAIGYFANERDRKPSGC
jgi:hypothetical protein